MSDLGDRGGFADTVDSGDEDHGETFGGERERCQGVVVVPVGLLAGHPGQLALQRVLDRCEDRLDVDGPATVLFPQLFDDGRRGHHAHVGLQQPTLELSELVFVQDPTVTKQVTDVRAEQVLGFSESALEAIEESHRGVLLSCGRERCQGGGLGMISRPGCRSGFGRRPMRRGLWG